MTYISGDQTFPPDGRNRIFTRGPDIARFK